MIPPTANICFRNWMELVLSFKNVFNTLEWLLDPASSHFHRLTPLFLDFLACQARCIAGNAELPKVLWIRVDLKGAAKRTNMTKPAGVCSLVSFAVCHLILTTFLSPFRGQPCLVAKATLLRTNFSDGHDKALDIRWSSEFIHSIIFHIMICVHIILYTYNIHVMYIYDWNHPDEVPTWLPSTE